MSQNILVYKPDAQTFSVIQDYEYFCDGEHLHIKHPEFQVDTTTYNAINMETKAPVLKKQTDRVFSFSKVSITVEM